MTASQRTRFPTEAAISALGGAYYAEIDAYAQAPSQDWRYRLFHYIPRYSEWSLSSSIVPAGSIADFDSQHTSSQFYSSQIGIQFIL